MSCVCDSCMRDEDEVEIHHICEDCLDDPPVGPSAAQVLEVLGEAPELDPSQVKDLPQAYVDLCSTLERTRQLAIKYGAGAG